MSGIELKPLSESKFGRSNFLLPLGKTIIGRGPVLGVSDKRVSRNHGVVEVEDGRLKIMSTHTNPTFYQAKGTSKLLPLQKEVWQLLENGDRIALTPDQHVYEVVIDERHLNKSSQSLGSPLSDSPVKQSPQKQQQQQKAIDEDKKDKQSSENNRQEDSSAGTDEKKTESSNNTEPVTKPIKEDEVDKEEGKENETRQDADKDADNDARDGADEGLSLPESKPGTLTLPDGKEMALPLEKERKLPSWMSNLVSDPAATEEKMEVAKETPKAKGRGRPKGTPTRKTATPKRAKKPVYVSDEASEDEYQPEVKRKASRGRGRPKGRGRGKGTGRGRPRRHHSDDDDEEEDDNDNNEEEEEDLLRDEGIKDDKDSPDEKEGPHRWGHGKTRDQASVKRKAKLALDYSEDFIVSEEEEEEAEEEMPVPEGDDGSDWEPESHSQRSARSPSKGKRSSGRTSGRTSGRKRSSRQRYSSRHSSDDEDSDLSEEEMYIPRPTKRSGRAVSSSLEPELSQDTPRKRAKKTDNGKKKRDACEYGQKCYRKNPLHKEELAHPGDSDYESPRSEDDDGDGEQEECPFGTDCYRKNKRHLEQYKHTKSPGRPKREAAKKKATVIDGGSDDDDEPNDYEDSFIDDGTQETGKGSESDGWTPGIKDDDDN